MDVHLMIAERRRVANEFRLARTCLAILRAHLSYSLTRETRQHLFPVIGEMSAKSRRLGAKLLEVDAPRVDCMRWGVMRADEAAAESHSRS